MTKTFFKIALTLSWFFVVFGLIVESLTEHTLPPVLKEYAQTQYQSSDAFSVSISGLAFIIIVALIVSYIGIYLWKNWARTLFITIFIIGYLLTPLYNEPIVQTIWTSDIYSLAYIFLGIAIGTMYFSNEIKEKFNYTSN